MSVNGITGVRSDISEMLAKMREVSGKSKVFSEQKTHASSSFNDIMSIAKNSVSEVSKVQTEAEAIKNSYILGDSNVSMSQVVVASQKSKLAFEGLMTVRNKILEAYKEIMSMQV